MRRNEYNSLEEFTNQYTGVRNPPEDLWLGLEFEYRGQEWRFQIYPMYKKHAPIIDGKPAIFGLYRRIKGDDFELLGEYVSMEDTLNSCVICNTPFREVIMDDETLLTAQD